MSQDSLFLVPDIGKLKADFVLKGGRIVSVTSEEIYEADVAIVGSRILAIGNVQEYSNPQTIVLDATGKFLVPGMIDGHQHFELSKLSPTMFARLVLPHGTTSIITGMDQIAGVAGLQGIRECLDESKKTGMKFFYGAPVKLPYTMPESTIGKEFGPEEHRISGQWPECYGVWETVADFVLGADPKAIEAMRLAFERRLIVAGSGAFLRGERLSAYVRTGIRCDHECFSPEEALEKIRDGLFVLLREGAGVYLLDELLQIVTRSKVGTRRIGFCTDGALPTEVLRNGHLDNMVRRTIKHGIEPINAIEMATINCAESFHIDHLVGNISPGRFADILIVDDLENFNIQSVIANGKVLAKEGLMVDEIVHPRRSEAILNTFNVKPVGSEDLTIRTDINSKAVKVLCMEVNTHNLFAKTRRDAVLEVRNKVVLPDVDHDILSAVVVERHRGTGNIGLGFMSGYKLKAGAIASSVSPDDNNIVAVGVNEIELAHAINHIIQMKGGQIVVGKGEILAFLHLPIAGLLSDMEPKTAAETELKLDAATHELGCDLLSPFTALMFLSIVAYPDFGLIDRGFVDCATHQFVNPIVGPA